jgi:UDP-N-acetyl-alpha-D-quinovosamine dehydrogenase
VTSASRRVLVTGAGGFVGRALCPALERASWTVIPAGRRDIGDIGPDTDWRNLLDGADAVIHLAARVHLMRDDAADPAAEFDRVNHLATARLAAQAAEAGVRRFIFMSSVKVHGDVSGHPLRAADPPTPMDPYGRSKYAAEHAIAVHRHGMETVVLRPPLVYGPGAKGNFLSLMRIIDRGWPLPFAAVENRRSMIYLGNLVDAILASLDVPPGIYLPSDRDDVSTATLIRRIAAGLGRSARLFPVPVWVLRGLAGVAGKAATIDRLCGSLTVDGRLPGWRPPFSMTEGLAATAQWYRRSMAAG